MRLLRRVVEMGGVEPPSESTLTGTSPGAAGCFDARTHPFPSSQANTQACHSGSFMIHGAGKAYRAHVPHLSTLRIRAVGLPAGTLAN